jgi:pimeloyl-ACP methyl ester carboxylesterase
MRLPFDDRAFGYQTLRALAYTTFGGAEPGEVLVTAERIPAGDAEAWHREWRRTAVQVEGTAATARDAGNDRTAREALQRAHTYYRTAEFFLAPDDPRRLPTYERARAAFRSAVDLFDDPVQRLEIPYEGTTLPGYLFVPGGGRSTDATAGPRPTVVCLGGFDSLAEELYFLCGVPEALARGYAVCLFEGPGQGAPLRHEGLTARPDWEHVVGPVLDDLVGRSAVDADRIALVGVSFGGYYAPRAAAFDDRVAACVAFDHMHDLPGAAAAGSPRLGRLVRFVPDAAVNALAGVSTRLSLESRWLLSNARWVFGVDSAAALQRALRAYTLVDVAGDVTCPTLVMAGEDDHFVPLSMAESFVDLLGGPTTLRVFTTEEGAGEHCQVGNLRLATGVIYDWLDGVL